MLQYLDPEHVAQIARDSGVPRSEGFADAVLQVGEPVLVNGPAVKKETWHTYSVRLERFRDGEGPHCEGLEEFVEKLDSPDPARLIGVKHNDKTWLAILEADDTLSAITTVEKPRANR